MPCCIGERGYTASMFSLLMEIAFLLTQRECHAGQPPAGYGHAGNIVWRSNSGRNCSQRSHTLVLWQVVFQHPMVPSCAKKILERWSVLRPFNSTTSPWRSADLK